MVGHSSATTSMLPAYLTGYQSRLRTSNNKDNMKNISKLFLILFAGLLVAQCSTYKIKPDMNKSGVVNKTPKWYVDYNHETMFKYQEAATAVSPDMELAVKKATLLAKAKLVDRINGEMNNRTTITKNEAGTNEDLNVTAGSQDVIVNVIEDTLARGYEVTKQEMYITKTKSYRVYIMIEVSKKEVEEIINQANKRRLALIDTKAINDQAKEILN
jgi:hypothetical protein